MSILAPELTNHEMIAPGEAGDQARRAASQVIRVAKDREFHSLGLVLGYHYAASPVIIDDGTPPLPEGQEYIPTARPGARLPHLWLPDGASLYDQLGPGLSLLRLREDVETAPLIEAAAARGAPLTVVDVSELALEAPYHASLLLVRPDQHIAWRGASIDQAGGQAVIDRVCGL